MPSTPLHRSVAISLVAVLALSGCFSNAKEAKEPVSETSTETSTGTPAPTGQPSEPLPVLNETSLQMAWNGCRGLGSTIFFFGNLVDLDDGQTPPGWEPTPTQDDRYYLTLNSCERVSVGPYERGPISFILETHTAVNPPEGCQEFESGFEDISILLAMWVSDQEVADYLASAYQMPVQYSDVSVTATATADGQTHQWTWSGGAEESSIIAFRPGGAEALSPFLDRLVWHNGTGVSFWDYHDQPVIPQTQSPPATGTLAPPMKYAQGNPRPYSGVTSVWNMGDFFGPLYRFGDMECTNLVG